MLYLQDSEVVFLESKFAILYLVDKRVVLAEVRKHAFINRTLVKHHLNLLERLIGTNYSIVDNRKNDFTHEMVEIFAELNSRVRLKKVAVVVHGQQIERITEVERKIVQEGFCGVRSCRNRDPLGQGGSLSFAGRLATGQKGDTS